MRVVTLPILIATLAQSASALASGSEALKVWSFQNPESAKTWLAAHDIQHLEVTDGVLRIALNGIDAYIVPSVPLDMPLDGVVVRVRLRGDHDGETQIYWQTADMPQFDQGACRSERTNATPPGQFQMIEFPIGRIKDSDKTLVLIRIDPFNGNLEGVVEIQSIEVLRTPPTLDIRFAFDAAQVDIDQPVKTHISIHEIAGARVRQPLLIGSDRDGTEVPLTQHLPTTQPIDLEDHLFDQPGVNFASAWLKSSPDQPALRKMAAVIVGKNDRLAIRDGLRSDKTRLDFIRSADEPANKIAGARWQVRDADGQWRQCGWLLPLFTITDASTQEAPPQQWLGSCLLQSNNERRAVLRFEGNPQVVELVFELVQRAGLECIDVRAELSHSSSRLFDFSGPTLRNARDRSGDPLDRFAIFGGIEFLEPGWPSSGTRGIGELLAQRWSPWPYKISLPVMAIEAQGVTSALMWNPQLEWTPGRMMPAATFASPNFLDGQPNHLMQLSVPGGKQNRLENSSCAQTPLEMHSNDRITLRYTLYAEANLPVAMVARRYYELFPPPSITPAPHNDRKTYGLIAQNFGQTMYQPGKGWTPHWFAGDKPAYHGQMAAAIIAHAIETRDNRWLKATGLEGKGIVEAKGSIASGLGLEAAARAAQNNMRPDGTWPFVNSPRMREQAREFTQNTYDSLGEDGSTSLGTCVQTALPLINYVRLTRDEKFLPVMIKALDAMHRFRVPRGAQVWEVHQEIPDIRAAALAVEAYQAAYEITGDTQYIDEASYWAWSGVSFIYSWHVPTEDQLPGSLLSSRDRSVSTPASIPFDQCFENPHRRITPYATIPVLGPTFYVIDWSGVPVQWCGLEWAWKVLELQRDRPDALLKYVTEGVVASGLQQMLDREPWVGLYPDSWLLESNVARNPLISATLPLQCLESQGRAPVWTRNWTRVVRGDSGRPIWHVTGWGPPPTLMPPLTLPTRWTVDLQYPPGQLNELILAHVEKPQRVSLETVLVNELSSAPPGLPEGWYYDADRRLAVVRFRQTASTNTLQFDW